MKLPDKREMKPLGISFLVLFLLAVIGTIFTSTSFIGMLSLSFAVFFYFLMPGYFAMLNFDFDALERIILGMAASSAIIPVFLYAINIIGFKITTTMIISSILLFISLSVLIREK